MISPDGDAGANGVFFLGPHLAHHFSVRDFAAGLRGIVIIADDVEFFRVCHALLVWALVTSDPALAEPSNIIGIGHVPCVSIFGMATELSVVKGPPRYIIEHGLGPLTKEGK